MSEVLSHMLEVLTSPTLCGWVGGDYSNILLNHVLSVPLCVVAVSSLKWDGESFHDVMYVYLRTMYNMMLLSCYLS